MLVYRLMSLWNYKNPGQIISIISKLCIISNKLYKLYNFISQVYIIYITADASVTIYVRAYVYVYHMGYIPPAILHIEGYT